MFTENNQKKNQNFTNKNDFFKQKYDDHDPLRISNNSLARSQNIQNNREQFQTPTKNQNNDFSLNLMESPNINIAKFDHLDDKSKFFDQSSPINQKYKQYSPFPYNKNCDDIYQNPSPYKPNYFQPDNLTEIGQQEPLINNENQKQILQLDKIGQNQNGLGKYNQIFDMSLSNNNQKGFIANNINLNLVQSAQQQEINQNAQNQFQKQQSIQQTNGVNGPTPIKREKKNSFYTPNSFNKKPTQFSSSQLKGADFSNTELDEDDIDINSRNARGLRNLSLKVKEIVCEQKQTTYKLVAEKLIQSMEKSVRIQDQLNKDEQNIKRRVYDALNVLIAADVLKKENKKVFCDDKMYLTHRQNNYQPQQKREQLRNSIDILKQKVKAKRHKLSQLVENVKSLHYLQSRNKEIMNKEQKQGQINEDSNSNKNNNQIGDQKIYFPFCCLFFSHRDQIDKDNLNLEYTKNQRKFKLFSKNKYKLIGDADLLTKLNFNQKFNENMKIEEFIDKQALKLIQMEEEQENKDVI